MEVVGNEDEWERWTELLVVGDAEEWERWTELVVVGNEEEWERWTNLSSKFCHPLSFLAARI